jgi:hypothetical protein
VPLAFADDWVNAASDWGREHAAWAWWPAPPPHPRRPVGKDVHAAYLLQVGILIAVVEAAWRRLGEPPGVAKLWRVRGVVVAVSLVATAVTDGAWDRRAARRRRLRR